LFERKVQVFLKVSKMMIFIKAIHNGGHLCKVKASYLEIYWKWRFSGQKLLIEMFQGIWNYFMNMFSCTFRWAHLVFLHVTIYVWSILVPLSINILPYNTFSTLGIQHNLLFEKNIQNEPKLSIESSRNNVHSLDKYDP